MALYLFPKKTDSRLMENSLAGKPKKRHIPSPAAKQSL